MSGQNSLSATDLAAYQHLGCDLFIHNVYHRATVQGQLSINSGNSLGHSNPQFTKGLDWETSLFSWLNESNLLLGIPPIALKSGSLLENILAEERTHFFVGGLMFWPPREAFSERFAEQQAAPINFGLAKPDLLEITKLGDLIQWRVVDAKASRHVKASHRVQLYFYDLCLQMLLSRHPFQSTGIAGVWLPPAGDFRVMSPSMSDIKEIPLSLLKPTMDTLLFRNLPKIITSPTEEVSWHYNPLCRGCRYEPECRSRAVKDGEIGSMPNISVDDARILKNLLHVRPRTTEKALPDIEELHVLFKSRDTLNTLGGVAPLTLKRAKEVLCIPRRISMTDGLRSPLLEACRTKQIRVIQRHNYTCPSREDIAIIISVVIDPSSHSTGGDYFAVTVLAGNSQVTTPSGFVCLSSEFISRVAGLIRTIECKRTCQFYVWSSRELTSVQNNIVQAALASSASDDDVRLCIGVLSRGDSLLRTTIQPLLLSGALLNFLTKEKRTMAQYKLCLERLGLPSTGTIKVLRERIKQEVRNLQIRLGQDDTRKEVGQLDRVVVMKNEIKRQLALPVPGYWDLEECAPLLNVMRPCPSDDLILTTYQGLPTSQKELKKLLFSRNRIIFDILKAFRSRMNTVNGSSYLVNAAKVISTDFVDICREVHIRKLFYMQQSEVFAKLKELWQSRIDGCPEAPVMQYCEAVQRRGEFQYTFRLLSGGVDQSMADSKDHAFFDKLLVPHTLDSEDGSDSLALEALFDDLGLSEMVFPLNRTTMDGWHKQHPRVQEGLLIADVQNIYPSLDRQHTMIDLRIWNPGRPVLLKVGQSYRLSPRLVDFNTTKILSSLFEIDLLWDSKKGPTGDGAIDHRDIPFLQLVTDPKSLDRFPMSEQYLKTGCEIQESCCGLQDSGNTHAASLVLRESQYQACQHILANRLSVIWGPPGTGKTYTVSLSLLRLITVERRHDGMQPKIVFVTAMTHNAIRAIQDALFHLMEIHRSLSSMERKWLENIQIHNISRGENYPPPHKSESNVEIYAGTMYQLSKFTKTHPIKIDCLIIDEAGQVPLGVASLVVASVGPQGRIILAGDTEQLAPILSGQYPMTDKPLFGSVLDCLMGSTSVSKPVPDDRSRRSYQGEIIQLVENFRLNPDIGYLVSTIYPSRFKPQKVQSADVATALQSIANEDMTNSIGLPSELLLRVQTFLVELSNAMLNKAGTSILMPPASHMPGLANRQYTSISLALIRLKVSSKTLQNISYESLVHAEATVAAALALLLKKCCSNDDIFVATPYRFQRDAAKAALQKAVLKQSLEEMFDHMDIGPSGCITVETIERLQGSEASFVICPFSAPKSFSGDLRFLLERRRLNVAISRTKTLCIIITSDEVLHPSTNVLADEATELGYTFLRTYQEMAWSYELLLQVEDLL